MEGMHILFPNVARKGTWPPLLSFVTLSYFSENKDDMWTALDHALQRAEQQDRRRLGPLMTSRSRATARPGLTISIPLHEGETSILFNSLLIWV